MAARRNPDDLIAGEDQNPLTRMAVLAYQMKELVDKLDKIDQDQAKGQSRIGSRLDAYQQEINSKLEYQRRELNDQLSDFSNRYVTRERFSNVEKIVYGLVGLILTAVVVALMAMVLRQGGL
jgi:hypothetical protein